MNISDRKLQDITLLDLDGNLVLEENAQFRKHIIAVIEAGARNLILNLANVPHTDSNGLGELISCYRAMERVGGRVILLRPNHRLRKLLLITKLITLFETFEHESIAVASFPG